MLPKLQHLLGVVLEYGAAWLPSWLAAPLTQLANLPNVSRATISGRHGLFNPCFTLTTFQSPCPYVEGGFEQIENVYPEIAGLPFMSAGV